MINDLYNQLKPISKFQDILNDEYFVEVPDTWWVVVTDVVNSTQAIEKGLYKDVNIAGGLAAMAISNHYKSMSLPFLFGGDGITFLIPPERYSDVRSILVDTRTKVKDFYSLDLRVGMVPISKLEKDGHKIYLGKFFVSSFYQQAVIKGSGVEIAESLIKSPNSPYLLSDEEPTPIKANFEGFTCRWQDIPSSNGETISVIIRIQDQFSSQSSLKTFYKELESVLGDEKEYHPIKEEYLKVSSSSFVFKKEAIVKGNGSKWLTFFALLNIYIETWVTRFVMKFQINMKAFFYDLKNLKSYQVASSDFRKFDGTLKMVVSVSHEKRLKLEKYLDSLEKSGNILYGIHVSNRALMTCLMHAGSEMEVHFVDSADGGYAMAAKSLKRKMKESKS